MKLYINRKQLLLADYRFGKGCLPANCEGETKYRVIRKSLWDFQPLWYSSQDGHAEGEHVNRGIDTPSFCPTLHVLDMSTLGDAAGVNPVIKFLPHTVARPGGTYDYSVYVNGF